MIVALPITLITVVFSVGGYCHSPSRLPGPFRCYVLHRLFSKEAALWGRPITTTYPVQRLYWFNSS